MSNFNRRSLEYQEEKQGECFVERPAEGYLQSHFFTARKKNAYTVHEYFRISECLMRYFTFSRLSLFKPLLKNNFYFFLSLLKGRRNARGQQKGMKVDNGFLINLRGIKDGDWHIYP